MMTLMGLCCMGITWSLVNRMKLQRLEVLHIPSEEHLTDAVDVFAHQRILSVNGFMVDKQNQGEERGETKIHKCDWY